MGALPEDLRAFGFAGFLGVSGMDYPGKVAAVLFTQGCNAHCHYCHNRMMIPKTEGAYAAPFILDKLKERSGFLDGVVISGGEPTIHPELPVLLRYCKDLGLAVKLDTNGLRPEVLQGVLNQHLVDYVAMDLKTTPQRYVELTDEPVLIEESIALLAASGVDHEFRTTCDGHLVSEGNIHAVASLVPRPSRYILQKMTGTDIDLRALKEKARQVHTKTTERGEDARAA